MSTINTPIVPPASTNATDANNPAILSRTYWLFLSAVAAALGESQSGSIQALQVDLADQSTLVTFPAPSGSQMVLYVQLSQDLIGGRQVTFDSMFFPVPPVNINLDPGAQTVYTFVALNGTWTITGIYL